MRTLVHSRAPVRVTTYDHGADLRALFARVSESSACPHTVPLAVVLVWFALYAIGYLSNLLIKRLAGYLLMPVPCSYPFGVLSTSLLSRRACHLAPPSPVATLSHFIVLTHSCFLGLASPLASRLLDPFHLCSTCSPSDRPPCSSSLPFHSSYHSQESPASWVGLTCAHHPPYSTSSAPSTHPSASFTSSIHPSASIFARHGSIVASSHAPHST